MSYWNAFMLTTREWIVVLYAIIIVFMIISMATLTICVVRNCCYVISTGDEEISCANGRISANELTRNRNTNRNFISNTNAKRDITISAPQQVPFTGQSFHTGNSDINRIDEKCPIHGQKKYHNNAELQKNSLLMDDGPMVIVN